MKRIFIPSAIVMALGLATLPAAYAANEGEIQFTGNILTATCPIQGQVPGSGSNHVSIALPDAAVGRLAAAGNTFGETDIVIAIGGGAAKDCPDNTTVQLSFDINSSAINTDGRLTIDSSTATNVDVEILQDGTVLDLENDKPREEIITSGAAEIKMTARYHATGQATAGPVATRVGYMVAYD